MTMLVAPRLAEAARYLLVGLSLRHRLLVVAHIEQPSRFELSVPARPRAGNAMTTKKKAKPRRVREPDPVQDTLRPEYDFSAGVRGKYAGRYPHGSIVVTLDPDGAGGAPNEVLGLAAA